MAWCRQAASHCLSQCCPRSLSPYGVTRPQWVNTLRPRQNWRPFADDIFKTIFFNENIWISLQISLKCVPTFVCKVRIKNILALVQIMAWRRPSEKPLSEPMMFKLPTHICVTRPKLVKCTWNALGIMKVQNSFVCKEYIIYIICVPVANPWSDFGRYERNVLFTTYLNTTSAPFTNMD